MAVWFLRIWKYIWKHIDVEPYWTIETSGFPEVSGVYWFTADITPMMANDGEWLAAGRCHVVLYGLIVGDEASKNKQRWEHGGNTYGSITNTEPAMVNVLECTTVYEAGIYWRWLSYSLAIAALTKKTSQD